MYCPTTTSYDYGAPVAEGGDHGVDASGGDKYEAVRRVLLSRAAKDTLGCSGVVARLPGKSPAPKAQEMAMHEEKVAAVLAPFRAHAQAIESGNSHFAQLIPGEPALPRRISSMITVDLRQRLPLMKEGCLGALVGKGVEAEDGTRGKVGRSSSAQGSTRCCDPNPPPMEELGCSQGFVVYETTIPAGAGGGLALSRLRDRVRIAKSSGSACSGG